MATLSDLKQDHKNARKRTQTSASLLKESLQRYGPARSIVIDEDNRILAGNGTVEAAINLGIDGLRIIDAAPDELIAVRRTGLTEDQKVGLALADNRTADLAEWDAEMLQQLSQEHDIAPWFQEDDLEALLEQVEKLDPVEGNTDPDEVPEAPEEPITRPGDLWILGNHRLLCGDSTNIQHVERLMDGQKADITFTSPPYNQSKNSHLAGRVKGFECKYENSQDAMSDDEYLALIHDATANAIGVSAYAFVNLQLLAHNKVVLTDYQHRLRHVLKDVLIWNKQVAPPNIVKGAFNTKFEYVYVFSQDAKTRGFPCQWQGKHPNVIETENNSSNQYAEDHRAGFPVVFPQWFIDRLDFVKSIYEPFCGTGTTLIAAERNRLTCYGMELDPAYCDVIVKRWEDFTGNTAICHPSDSHFANTEDDI
jgi:DNA modification methylase